MTQEKDKQEKPKDESASNELPDAELDKVSGGVGVAVATKPTPPEPPAGGVGRFDQSILIAK